MTSWRNDSQPARLSEPLPNGVVRCHLSPRNCVLKPGQHGFCGVRENRGGTLVTLNYGKSVHATEETIETEAVNHFAPGERILSMGNIGCMLNCSYCHNWKTSQAKHVSDSDVRRYTPEDVIDIAVRHGIRVLSWTYNDPVVWHEFVLETAKLAHQRGLINLYKSAFYITLEAVDELLPYIDIFSISIKSMDPQYYRKFTKGTLEPVLEATRHVYKSGKHVEVSTLMITDISDNEASARDVTNWVLTELDASVPMHFVRFHPDYRMRDTIRTPIRRLVRAREVARELGAEHVYLGNVYDTPHSNTYCNGCQAVLVTRYGLNAAMVGLDGNGHCAQCGRDAHVRLLGSTIDRAKLTHAPDGLAIKSFDWFGDVRALHVQVDNPNQSDRVVYVGRRMSDGAPQPWRVLELAPHESFRFIVAKSTPRDIGCDVALPSDIHSNLHEVFDRAHFPTVAIEKTGVSRSDVSPLPMYRA